MRFPVCKRRRNQKVSSFSPSPLRVVIYISKHAVALASFIDLHFVFFVAFWTNGGFCGAVMAQPFYGLIAGPPYSLHFRGDFISVC